jgi:phosphatidylglycerophosphate synthase
MAVLPNLLTLSRVAAALAIAVAPASALSIPLMAWGALSDFLDGYVARRCQSTSDFGAAFDLGADGFFFLACFVGFWRTGTLPTLWFGLILAATLPELAAQAVMFLRGTRRVGSPGRLWNRVLGGYSYACVFGIAFGLAAVPLAAAQVALELWANTMDLGLALKK